jgi:hypothetical protein
MTLAILVLLGVWAAELLMFALSYRTSGRPQ